MSDWDWKHFVYTFATTSIDPMVRKAFRSLKQWLDNWVDIYNDLSDAFDVHWPRHEFGGDDEGTVESLATDVDDEGQTLRSAGGRELEFTNRFTTGAADMDLTLLIGNTGVDGAAVHDGFIVSKRTDVKFEVGYTMPLLNCDMEDNNSGVPRWWTKVEPVAGITSSQSDAEVYKGSYSWLLYVSSPTMI